MRYLKSRKKGDLVIRGSGFGDWVIRRLGIKAFPISQSPNIQIPITRYPNNLFLILFLVSCFLFLASCIFLPRYAWADDNVVMEIKDDLTVLGTSGIDTDADVEIKGYTVMEGNLDLNLDALTEGFTLDKALTAGAAYTDNEFVLTREIIGGAWDLSGDLLRIWDKSATTGTNTANLLNLGTGGTFSSTFKVDLTGDLTAGDKTSFHGVEYTWPNAIAGDNFVLSVNQGTGDLTWKSVAGVDGVTVSGSPLANQVAVWASPSSILGDANFTWDASSLTLGDTALSPSGSNVLSLATGDSFNIVSGNLQAGGNNVITPDPYLRVGDGAAVTPSVSFLNDTNSGMYSLGADKLGIITNGTATQGITIDATGQVGIGTISPGAKLDVEGDAIISGGLYGINVETLSGDKTLTPDTDKMYQYLDEGGADRIITLATATAQAGDRFVIRHNGAFDDSHYLSIKQGATVLDNAYAGVVKEFIFDGTNWISGETGSGEDDFKKYNVVVGRSANGYDYGTAVGYDADGHSSGVAVGLAADGYDSGAAVGYGADADSSGAAVGYATFGKNSGAAVGYAADGRSYGTAIGALAQGFNYGVAIGYKAGDNLDFSVNPNKNILVGFQAGDSLTFGDNNIIIGYDQDTPTATTDNHLNIGGLIYGDLSGGEIGIGVVDPDEQLELTGRVHLGQTTAPGTTTDKLYNVGGTLYWDGTDVTGTGTVISGTDNYLARFNAAGDNVENSGLVDESDAVAITIDSSERVGIGTTAPGEALDVAGNIAVSGTVDGVDISTLEAGVPSGVIVMWSGTLASIPADWTLCDGTNGSPDLRDRFIFGWTSGVNPGGTGGAGNHTHTQTANNKLWRNVGWQSIGHDHGGAIIPHEFPDFTPPTEYTIKNVIWGTQWDYHQVYSNTILWDDHQIGSDNEAEMIDSASYDPTAYLNYFQAVYDASLNPSSNIPPYYKLAFIMKL